MCIGTHISLSLYIYHVYIYIYTYVCIYVYIYICVSAPPLIDVDARQHMVALGEGRPGPSALKCVALLLNHMTLYYNVVSGYLVIYCVISRSRSLGTTFRTQPPAHSISHQLVVCSSCCGVCRLLVLLSLISLLWRPLLELDHQVVGRDLI